VQKFRRLAEYVAFRLFGCLLGMLSWQQSVRLGSAFAWLMTRALPAKLTRYRLAYDNIRQSFPEMPPAEIDRTIHQMWVHLFRLVVETIQLQRKVTLTNCREVFVFRQRHRIIEKILTGRPVFVLGGHYGNWEVSTAAFGMFGYPMGLIAREMDNPYLHDWFVRSRQHTGHKLYLKQGGWDDMVKLLQAGGSLGLLGDQDAGKRGVFVDFFGRPASTFKSIALMAMEYKAVLVVGYGIRLPDAPDARWARFEIGVEEVIDPLEIDADDVIEEITNRYTRGLEAAIRRAPEQYFWVHNRWKSKPGEKRNRARKAA
jgi:KDO2-lipid IV(A) lauroyltransferase